MKGLNTSSLTFDPDVQEKSKSKVRPKKKNRPVRCPNPTFLNRAHAWYAYFPESYKFAYRRHRVLENSNAIAIQHRSTLESCLDAFGASTPFQNDSRSTEYGPSRLLGDFEQVMLLRLIVETPGIYLHELRSELFNFFGVYVNEITICKTLRFMGCTRQAMRRVALQQSDILRAQFMATISMYDPQMLVWLDESGCDHHNTIRKYAYSIRGMPLCDHRILCRGKRYSTIPIMSLDGIHDVYITEGTVDGEKFTDFIRKSLLPILFPFNNVNPYSVVIMDNASIHHVNEVATGSYRESGRC